MATNEYVLDKAAFQTYQEQQHTKQAISAKKKAEFNALLKRAIENEIPVDDAVILEMYFFQGYTKTKIAEFFGVNPSTISRRINKSLDILYEKLKYAAEYRFGFVIEKKEGAK